VLEVKPSKPSRPSPTRKRYVAKKTILGKLALFRSGDHVALCTFSGFGSGEDKAIVLARRICRLLNAAEAGKGTDR